MYLMLPVKNFPRLEIADVLSLLLFKYRTRHLLQHFSAGEMLHKHLVSSHLRYEGTEVQRKKVIHSRSLCRADANLGLPSPSSAPTQWVILYQHPAERSPGHQKSSNGNPLTLKSVHCHGESEEGVSCQTFHHAAVFFTGMGGLIFL